MHGGVVLASVESTGLGFLQCYVIERTTTQLVVAPTARVRPDLISRVARMTPRVLHFFLSENGHGTQE